MVKQLLICRTDTFDWKIWCTLFPFTATLVLGIFSMGEFLRLLLHNEHYVKRFHWLQPSKPCFPLTSGHCNSSLTICVNNSLVTSTSSSFGKDVSAHGKGCTSLASDQTLEQILVKQLLFGHSFHPLQLSTPNSCGQEFGQWNWAVLLVRQCLAAGKEGGFNPSLQGLELWIQS